MNGLRHQAQHAARALEFFERSPTCVELVEQFGMDRISLFQLAPVILIRAALREIVGVLAVELGELLQRVVAVVEFVARDVLEQPPPDDLITLFLTSRSPRGFHAAEGLLETRKRLLTAFAADLDLRGRQGRDE